MKNRSDLCATELDYALFTREHYGLMTIDMLLGPTGPVCLMCSVSVCSFVRDAAFGTACRNRGTGSISSSSDLSTSRL
jgi:hypothetical protein